MTTSLGHCPHCHAEIAAAQGGRCPHCGYQMNPSRFGFIPCVIFALRRGLSLRGRATRAEYWWFTLFCLLVAMLLGALTILNKRLASPTLGASLFIIPLLLHIPMFCQAVRRLHDTGRNACAAVCCHGLALLATIAELIAADSFSFTNTLQMHLHATTSSPFYNILILSSYIFGLYISFIALMDSQRGPNKYGPSPKYPTSAPASSDIGPACSSIDPLPCVASALRRYCCFHGRASRAEFWWFFLFTIIAFSTLSNLSSYISNIIVSSPHSFDASLLMPTQTGPFALLQKLHGPVMEQSPVLARTLIFFHYLPLLLIPALFLPSLAVTVRRMHDINVNSAIAYITFAAGLPFIISMALMLYNISTSSAPGQLSANNAILPFLSLIVGISILIFIPGAIICLICGMQAGKSQTNPPNSAPLLPEN